jgi:hypothetical protein
MHPRLFDGNTINECERLEEFLKKRLEAYYEVGTVGDVVNMTVYLSAVRLAILDKHKQP